MSIDTLIRKGPQPLDICGITVFYRICHKCIVLHSALGFFALTPLLNFWTICVQNPTFL